MYLALTTATIQDSRKHLLNKKTKGLVSIAMGSPVLKTFRTATNANPTALVLRIIEALEQRYSLELHARYKTDLNINRRKPGLGLVNRYSHLPLSWLLEILNSS